MNTTIETTGAAAVSGGGLRINAPAPAAHLPAESSDAAKYRAILDKKIAEGSRAAARVIDSIQNDVPEDQIANAQAIRWQVDAKNIVAVVGDKLLAPSSYALGQIAERAGVPAQYMREMSTSEDEWRRVLAAEIAGRHFGNVGAQRVLVRSVRGQLRGFLSDKYRRLDNRPLLDALVKEVDGAGAVPCGGTMTETRCALKVIVPRIVEVLDGEFVVFGGEWSNSDYGNGAHSFRAFALRVVCLNGMTRENLLRQIHLGGRLQDDVQYSDRTYRLDTAASVSALQDTVRGALGPAGINSMTAAIRAANEKEMSEATLLRAAKNVPKKTQKLIVDAFKSDDVINLPAGNTAWRASNAVSWIARHTTDDAELQLDLERLAGGLT